jgi:hypothetical protein
MPCPCETRGGLHISRPVAAHAIGADLPGRRLIYYRKPRPWVDKDEYVAGRLSCIFVAYGALIRARRCAICGPPDYGMLANSREAKCLGAGEEGSGRSLLNLGCLRGVQFAAIYAVGIRPGPISGC